MVSQQEISETFDGWLGEYESFCQKVPGDVYNLFTSNTNYYVALEEYFIRGKSPKQTLIEAIRFWAEEVTEDLEEVKD